MQQSRAHRGNDLKTNVSYSKSDNQGKRVTYKDQRQKHEKKAQRRQKHTQEAYKNLQELLNKRGAEDAETIAAVEFYTEKSCETATYMMDKGEHEDAGKVLEDCALVLKSEVRANYPRLLYKINYRLAELQNSKGLHQESLVYLKQAIVMAEEQESMDGDPLTCMPAETYLNTAIALQYAERFGEAMDIATNAGKVSQKSIVALSEVQQQPKAFRQMSRQEAQSQLMIQLDIQIQSYLIQGQILEKMDKYEEALQTIQHGKRLLEQHFGPQHPLISDFNQADQAIKMQIAPDAVAAEGRLTEHGNNLVTANFEIEPENIGTLLDKRSDLMKRGRVKRVYYKHTDEVHTSDMRQEFADLEELEDQQAQSEANRCAQTQSSWMQRQQLMAMRQQQDEQFRMMELLMSSKQRQQVNCNHPQVYMPMQYQQSVMQIPASETEESSSEPSETTTEEEYQPEPVRKSPTPPPVQESSSEKPESSVSSQSDSYECQSDYMGEMKNFQSEDSESDTEAPPTFLNTNYDPRTVNQRVQVRSSGREFIFKEKNFKSGIYLTKRKLVEEPVIIEPVVDVIIEPEPPRVNSEWRKLSLIILIQAKVRRFLQIRRRRQDNHFGEVCPIFYLKYEIHRYKVSIYKVQVAHTIKRKRTRVQHTRVRHHDQSEMQQVEEKVEHAAAEEHKQMIIMFQIILECMTDSSLGTSQCLVSVIDFPSEFPYLIDYMRACLIVMLVPKKGRNFQVEFSKLEWTTQQQIIHSIKQMLIDIDNRMHRKAALIFGEDDGNRSIDVNMEDYQSQGSNRMIQEIDYEAIQKKIELYKSQGHDLQALRLKIQYEARQIIDNEQIQSTELNKIVHRDIRKEREWTDYIRINRFRQVDSMKTTAVRKPGIMTIVKIQAMIRGFLARRQKPKGLGWTLLFDFIVHQHNKYYIVRVYKAPDELFGRIEFPYQVVANRHMTPKDTHKQLRRELPFPLPVENCRERMLESVQILIDNTVYGNIREIRFKAEQISTHPQKKIEHPINNMLGGVAKALKVKVAQEVALTDQNAVDEFIDDWKLPNNDKYELYEIRKFRILYPQLIVTLSYELTQMHGAHYNVDVVYRPNAGQESSHRIILHKLPVELDYMVYFIRQHLKVYFTDNDVAINYAALSGFQHGTKGNKAFEIQMQRLRKQLQSGAEERKKQSELAKHIEQIEKDTKQMLDGDNQKLNFNHTEHGIRYVVKLLKNVPLASYIVPFRMFVHRESDMTDFDYIDMQRMNLEGQELELFIIRYLRIYIDPDTTRIKYAALTKIEKLVMPQQEPEIDIHAIVKIQSLVRMWLAKRRIKREFEGFVTRFIMKEGDGRRVRITVWKTIVEHTRKKKTVQHVKERKDGGILKDEVKQVGEVETIKEQIEAYQIEALNIYIDENHHEKIVIKLPPPEIMIEALKEAIVLNWQGSFSHQLENLRADWLDSISYKKLDQELIKRITKNQKKNYKQHDRSRYKAKIGIEDSHWVEVTDCIIGDYRLRLLEADNARSLDSLLVKILAHPKNETGVFDEDDIAGTLTMSVKEVANLIAKSMSEQEMADMQISSLCHKLSYHEKHVDWDVLLSQSCSVLSSGNIFIDEMQFQSNRYGFDVSQARTDMKAVQAALLMQRFMRRYLGKRRVQRMIRTPGYATSTGVFIQGEVYLVYLLRASKDQNEFSLTLKQRLADGSRAPVIEKHNIGQEQIDQAVRHFPGMFKLQSITKLFEQDILTAKIEFILQNNPSWKSQVIQIIQQEF